MLSGLHTASDLSERSFKLDTTGLPICKYETMNAQGEWYCLLAAPSTFLCISYQTTGPVFSLLSPPTGKGRGELGKPVAASWVPALAIVVSGGGAKRSCACGHRIAFHAVIALRGMPNLCVMPCGGEVLYDIKIF